MVKAELVQIPQAFMRTYLHQNAIEFSCSNAGHSLLMF
jgi:hypothetical protein